MGYLKMPSIKQNGVHDVTYDALNHEINEICPNEMFVVRKTLLLFYCPQFYFYFFILTITKFSSIVVKQTTSKS
jgi:hypothetical protein